MGADREKVHVAVYVPTGYGDKDLRVEIVPDGGASGGGLVISGRFRISPAPTPPAGSCWCSRRTPPRGGARAGWFDRRERAGGDAPLARRAAVRALADESAAGRDLDAAVPGDPDFARALRQPYVTHETNEEVTVTFDALPFWVRKDDVRVDVTHAGVRVRCESAGLENLERTFWRGDDAEAGRGDAEDAEGADASSGGGRLVTNVSSVDETEKERKKHEPFVASRDRVLVPRAGRDANDGRRAHRRVRRRRVAPTPRDRQARPDGAGVAVQEGHRAGQQAGQARVEPRPKLGRAAVPEDEDDFFLEDDLTALVFFETPARRRVRRSPGPRTARTFARWRARRRSCPRTRAVLEHLVAMAEAEDGDVQGRPRRQRRGVMGALGRARVERNRVASLLGKRFFVRQVRRACRLSKFDNLLAVRRFVTFSRVGTISSRLRRALRAASDGRLVLVLLRQRVHGPRRDRHGVGDQMRAEVDQRRHRPQRVEDQRAEVHEAGAEIDIDRSTADPVTIRITGDPKQVKAAREAVRAVIKDAENPDYEGAAGKNSGQEADMYAKTRRWIRKRRMRCSTRGTKPAGAPRWRRSRRRSVRCTRPTRKPRGHLREPEQRQGEDVHGLPRAAQGGGDGRCEPGSPSSRAPRGVLGRARRREAFGGGGGAVLMPAVVAALKEKGLKFEEKTAGSLIVQLA